MDLLQNNKPGAKVPGWLDLDFWGNQLLLLYIFTMPFVSAFAFTGTLSLPLFFAVFLFMLMGIEIIRLGKLPDGFIGFDMVIIALFLFLCVFTFILNGLGNQRSLNHTIAYISTFLLFYVAIKFTYYNIRDKDHAVIRTLQFISYVTIISAIFANIEFILNNFFGFDLNEYIPRVVEGEAFYNPLVVSLFVRARGFATESGHFTFMMELFSPLTLYYMYFSGLCKWKLLSKVIIIIIIFFSFVFAASSASFVILPFAIFVASVLHLKKVYRYLKRNPGKFVIASTLGLLIFLVFNYFLSLYAFILLSVTDKMDSGSLDDRQERIDFFFEKFSDLDPLNKIAGVGPAGFHILGFDDTKSILSLYYSITFEVGYLGLLLILFLFFYFFIHALKIKTAIGFFLLVALTAGIMHYYFIANFWYPWFWFIAAFAIFCNKKSCNE